MTKTKVIRKNKLREFLGGNNEKYKHKTLTKPELLDADDKMYMHVPYNIQ
jgi:hypothetical protein